MENQDTKSIDPITSPVQTPIPSVTPVIPTAAPKASRFPIFFVVLILILLTVTGVFAYQNWQMRQQLNAPTTYEECIKAPGSVLQESYPATCVTKDGKSFRQILTDEEKKKLEPPDPTTNWNTYIFQGLVFKYPTDWVLDTEKMAIRPPYLKDGEEYPAITFYIIKNPDNLSIKEYDNKAGNSMMRPGLYSSSIGTKEIIAEAKTVNGINGYYLKDQNCEPLGCDRFSFVSSMKIYVITNIFDHQDISSQNLEKENLRKIFNQILSTFKFKDTLPKKTEGAFCGGFAGTPCPNGYTCKLEGNYPDAGGVCIKEF